MKTVWLTACYPGDFIVGTDGNWSWRYVGGNDKGQSLLFGVKSNVSFPKLYDTLEKKLEINSNKYEMVLRYPSLVGFDHPPYIIKDDDTVKALISCSTQPRVYITLKAKSDGGIIELMSDDTHGAVDMNYESGYFMNDNVEESMEAGVDGIDEGVEVDKGVEVDEGVWVDAGVRVDVNETTLKLISNVDSGNATVDYIPGLDDELNDISPIGQIEVDRRDYAVVTPCLTMNQPLSSVRIPDVEDVHHNDHYETKFHLISALQRLAIKYHFEFKSPRSTKKAIVMICVHEPCQWRLRATNDGDSQHFVVRSYEFKHSCSLSVQKTDHKQATTSMIGNYIAPRLLDRNCEYTPKDIISDFHRQFGYKVGYKKAFDGLKHAKVLLRGNPRKSFGKLPKFFHALESANPGTITSIETVKSDDKDAFRYCFMAIGACIRGYQSSIRRVISVDGTFLTGDFKGTLLVAACQDGNNNIFPLAFGVVNSENNESWTWFFRKLKAITGDSRELAILSDGALSIKHGFHEVFQNACHGRCTYHLLKNLKSQCPRSDVADLFERAARAYTVENFKKYFDALCLKHKLVRSYLQEQDFRSWSRAHFHGLRYDIMTTNHAESINSLLKSAKWFPIVGLLSEIRDILQRWFAQRRANAQQCGSVLTPNMEDEIMKRVNDLRDVNSNVKVEAKVICDPYLYQVCVGLKSYTVDLDARTCMCRQFDLDKVPCIHAIAAARHASKNIYDLCSDYFKTSFWRNAYSGIILPLSNEEGIEYPEHILSKTVVPPVVEKKKPGRPFNTDREKGAGEPRKKESRKSKKTRETRKESGETRKKYNKTREIMNNSGETSDEHPENCGETNIRDEHVLETSTEEYEESGQTLFEMLEECQRKRSRKRPKFASLNKMLEQF